jgi:hypothetical protein
MNQYIQDLQVVSFKSVDAAERDLNLSANKNSEEISSSGFYVNTKAKDLLRNITVALQTGTDSIRHVFEVPISLSIGTTEFALAAKSLFGTPYVIYYSEDFSLHDNDVAENTVKSNRAEATVAHEFRHYIDERMHNYAFSLKNFNNFPNKQESVATQMENQKKLAAESKAYLKYSRRSSLSSAEYKNLFNEKFNLRYKLFLNYYTDPSEFKAWAETYGYLKYMNITNEQIEADCSLIVCKTEGEYIFNIPLPGGKFISFPEIPKIIELHKILLKN